jgi:hypothetical protein
MNLRPIRSLLIVLSAAGLAACNLGPVTPPSPASTPTPPPAAAASSPAAQEGPESVSEAGNLFAILSLESMLETIRDLSAIQPHSGWRSAGSQGETEALDYVQGVLEGYSYLQGLGLEIDRQTFPVLLGTEIRQARLQLTMGGREIEAAADALRGHRYDIGLALNFDSDGELNDTESDPVVVEGPVVLARSTSEVRALTPGDVAGKIVMVDYAALDRSVLGREWATMIAEELAAAGPAGLILVTHYSNRPTESTGFGIADISALSYAQTPSIPPTLYIRLEDLASSGIEDWEDLARVESARLTWDADVFSPGTSGNLVARIPGLDPSRALILGAHIDSPNNPGAMDNGSGSAVLLEVARVLDGAQVQPPLDLVLVWFGSEETGLLGSAFFAATHQELLERTVAMLGIDCLSYPLEGSTQFLRMYAYQGEGSLAWPEALLEAASSQGIEIDPVYEVAPSDSSAFTGFGVSNGDLIYEDRQGNLGHIHDPYDTLELAQQMGSVLEQMAQVALLAALDTAEQAAALPPDPVSEYRALFVASHTEPIPMTPALILAGSGATLAGNGYDVDMLPHGHLLSPSDLEGADLVIALPVVDYALPDESMATYDEAWSEAEIATLQDYVAEGGLLVLTNSAHLTSYSWLAEDNEDRSDANALAGRFGVTYLEHPHAIGNVQVLGSSPLTEGLWELATSFSGANGVSFAIETGQVLARRGEDIALALVDYGDGGGQVLVLADVGWLGGENPRFWQNLASFARDR